MLCDLYDFDLYPSKHGMYFIYVYFILIISKKLWLYDQLRSNPVILTLGLEVLHSRCPGQVVSLTRDLHCLVHKPAWYLFYWSRRDERSLDQLGVELSTRSVANSL